MTVDEQGVEHTVVKKSILGHLEAINVYAYRGFACIEGVLFMYTTVKLFLFVDSRPRGSSLLGDRSANTRRNQLVRLGLFFGTLISIALGSAITILWEDFGLVRVTRLEHILIVIPIQIYVGMVLTSIVQHMVEGEQTVGQDQFRKF